VVREERLASDLEAAEVLRADLEGAIRAASEALVVLRGEHEAAQAGATAARVAIAAARSVGARFSARSRRSRTGMSK